MKFLVTGVELATGRFAILSPQGAPVGEVAPHECPPGDGNAASCAELAGTGGGP